MQSVLYPNLLYLAKDKFFKLEEWFGDTSVKVSNHRSPASWNERLTPPPPPTSRKTSEVANLNCQEQTTTNQVLVGWVELLANMCCMVFTSLQSPYMLFPTPFLYCEIENRKKKCPKHKCAVLRIYCETNTHETNTQIQSGKGNIASSPETGICPFSPATITA